MQRNRERGVPDEVLKDKEKELIEGAGGLAAHRLKTNFILHRIAEQEKIQVTREDVDERIRDQAAHYNVSVEKMRKELEENDGMNGLAEQVLLGKTLDFLKANVTIEAQPKHRLPDGCSERIKHDDIATKISLNPCSFRWWSSRPAAASAATTSIRGC